jgi:tRNA 2-thiouridine synthesizing protein A
MDSAPNPYIAPSAADLAERLDRALSFLATAAGAPCELCGRAICGHEALMSYAAGRRDAPCCASCLADDVGRTPANLRDELAGYILRKDCLSKAWGVATTREGFAPTAPPACLWPAAAPAPAFTPPDAPTSGEPPRASARWDAGDMACGELVLELRLRIASMSANEVLLLTACDRAAPEDLPAWCRLTGNDLVGMRPPDYWIRRRE